MFDFDSSSCGSDYSDFDFDFDYSFDDSTCDPGISDSTGDDMAQTSFSPVTDDETESFSAWQLNEGSFRRFQIDQTDDTTLAAAPTESVAQSGPEVSASVDNNAGAVDFLRSEKASYQPGDFTNASSTVAVATQATNISGLTDDQVLAGKSNPSSLYETVIDHSSKTISVLIGVNYDTGSLSGSEATRLMSLAQDGVSQFWSRTIDLNGETYSVNVNLTEDSNGMSIKLKNETANEYPRSFNANGAPFPLSLPGGRIIYQEGWFANQKLADMDFQVTGAHEIGHPIQTEASGVWDSWGHGGTSGIFGTPLNVPPNGDLDLMKYYNNLGTEEQYTRSIATETDVKNLVYLSKRP